MLYVSLKADMSDEWKIVVNTANTEKLDTHSMGAVEFFPEKVPTLEDAKHPLGSEKRRVAPAAVILGEGFEFSVFIHQGLMTDTTAYAVLLIHRGDGTVDTHPIKVLQAPAGQSYEALVDEIETTINNYLEELD